MNIEEGNETIQKDLSRLVVEEITGLPFDKVHTTIGKLAINYFSFVFSIKAQTPNGSQRVFVKIPKEDLRQRSKSILPISPADRTLASDEELSLRMLNDRWHSDDLDIFWVRLRSVFPQYNAIVTDAIEGDDAFAIFRKLDLRRRLGSNKDSIRLREVMARFGKALGRFHQGNARAMVFRVNEILPKLEHYCRELGSSTRNPLLNKAIKTLDSIADLEIDTLEVLTLKGLDIRNVLMDKQDKLFLLDPGRMKQTCREADLARFIMTFRIIYWGRGLFLLRLSPDYQAEKAFLDAYYSNTTQPSKELLSLFLIKEQLKHWQTAIYSLGLLTWPITLKRLVAATYVNPYYTRQLAMELKKVF
jgi:hypothetical protein